LTEKFIYTKINMEGDMKMLYVSGIILISMLFYITLWFKYKQLPFIIFAGSGVILLFIASLLYTFRMSEIYNSNFFLSFRVIYKIATSLRISFQEIYRMMLIGGFLVFLSCVSMAFTMILNMKKIYSAIVLLPLYAYLFINDPEISFRLYLESSIGKSVVYIMNSINVYNILLIIGYFLFPIISILIYYKKTTFMIKKRHAVFMLIYMIMYYILIFVMDFIGFIRFFQLSRTSIFRFHTPNVSDFTFSSVILFICIVVSVIVVLSIKTNRMQNYSTKALLKNTEGIDKNLRMILHTYKNHFFAINQQINFLRTLDEPYSDDARRIFDSIDEVSKTSINEISDRINALKNVKMVYRPIDLNSCIDKAIEKVFIPQNIKMIKEFYEGQVIVFSESRYLIEMICNLVQNSVEAITSKNSTDEEFSITVRTALETDWVLLEVEDNGCGIGEKEKKRIFEPLFSGKQGKNNFGMGLYYVQKVVAVHNGYIFVESTPGKFTKFQIYLRKNNVGTMVKVKDR